MFDIGWDEMLFTAMVAIVVIGPKDLPRALRTAGRWIGKVRRVSGHFRAGIETMIREAELEDMEKQWREQNEAIMRQHDALPTGDPALVGPDPGTQPDAAAAQSAEAPTGAEAPELPLAPGKTG
ncbi:MAG: Sec-independent protein translocase protein TatB [Novosphingobium sp.]